MDTVCNWEDDADDDEEELADIKIGLSELDIITDSPLEDSELSEGTATHSWYYPALDISLGSAGLILIATLMFPFYFYFIYISNIYIQLNMHLNIIRWNKFKSGINSIIIKLNLK